MNVSSKLIPRFSKPRLWLCLFAVCGMDVTAPAQLAWGPGGTGGGGTWNTTNVNWWDGSQNVAWNNGGSAVFGGTAGAVTVGSPFPSVSAITFNTPGYVIQNGSLNGASNLTITADQSATISTTLFDPGFNSTLMKTGTATLTVAGTNFYDNVNLLAGEYRVGGSSSLFFSKVTLTDAPGVLLTLGQSSDSTSLAGLSGGGAFGGMVQPNEAARTVRVTNFGGGTFGGTLANNGAGVLAIDQFSSGATQIFTGVNTYSGATTISSGTLAFAGSGSALNSAVTVGVFGVLLLDNSGVPTANRLSDSAGFAIQGGRVQFVGNGATAVDEVLGNLTFSGASSISATQPGGAIAQLNFSGATRASRGTLDITGNGRTVIAGLVNGSTGILPAEFTFGADWATLDSNGSIVAFGGYAPDLNSASPNDHVKISGGNATLIASAIRASVNLQTSGAPGVLDLGGQTLTLAAGGLFSSGSGAQTIQNGALTAGGTELIIHSRNAVTVNAAITETASGMGLTKSGTGSVTLSGNNSYSGTTAIVQGTLIVSADGNLGTGSTLEFNGGALRAGASFASSKALSNGVPLVGTIDTNGFDVSFAGAVSGSISKTGAGTLTLWHPDKGSASVSQGRLVLPNAASGSADLRGGTLVVSGSLSRLTLDSFGVAPVLDIGGSAAATLQTGSFFASGNNGQLRINFGIGSSGSDLWNLEQPLSSFGLAAGAFAFDFQNLGGAMTGVDYTLLTFPSAFGISASSFAFTPESSAAGWTGTFLASSTSVRVNFTTVAPVPEPGTGSLFFAGLALLSRRRVWRLRGSGSQS